LDVTKATKAKQLSFVVENRVGLLADVTAALASRKINVTALVAYELDNQGVFMMLTDNNPAAKKVLAKYGAKAVEEDVVLLELPDRPGALQSAVEKVAEAGIDILYVYATSGKKTGTFCVMQTEDNRKAIKAVTA